jgi:hypothetical protein
LCNKFSRLAQKQEKYDLKEGCLYNFIVLKSLKLPDDKEYFVTEDPRGKKHLLLKSFYESYNISVGETITCKVDKINCNGKIFLEPQHPYLKDDHQYDFEITCTEEIYNNMVDPEQTLFCKRP